MSRTSSQVSQNVDNFLSEKSSTRLHKPPGGGSTVGNLIFGGGCDESPFAGHQRRASVGRTKDEAPEQSNPYPKDSRRGSGGYTQQSASGPYPGFQQSTQQPAMGNQQYSSSYQHQQQQPFGSGAGRQLSSNSYASGSNQNAGNVLTERRITRIHAPPGGKTSITFG